MIQPGNWTSSVTSNLDTNSGTNLYPIGFNAGNPDPAPKCDKKTFYASYKCGNDTVVRNISAITDAIGKQAKFDCTDLFNICNGTSLHLGDDGILRMFNNSQKEQVWDSTQAPTNATPLSSEQTLSLDAFKPANNPTAKFKNRSYLNSGEFLKRGQFISSPNGKCRLEMYYNITEATNRWRTIRGTFTSVDKNSILRGTNSNLLKYGINSVVLRIPNIGTKIELPNDFNLKTITTKDQSWVTIDRHHVANKIIYVNTWGGNSPFTVRYGSNGRYDTKTYPRGGLVKIPSDFITYTRLGKENSQITPPNGKATLYRYGKYNKWVYKTFSGPFTADNATFGDPRPGFSKVIESCTTEAPTATLNYPNSVDLQVDSNANDMSNTLQVVYNAPGCTDIDPININSSKLYSIPWTSRDNLGKMGYVNEHGQLRIYDSSINTSSYSSSFTKQANKDGITYGMYGADLPNSLFENVADEASCQVKCSEYGFVDGKPPKTGVVNCAGFEYEKKAKTCQLKGDEVFTNGIRRINPPDGSKNYEYYSRLKSVSDLDTSCTTSVTSGTADDWQKFKLGNTMTSTSKCGLTNAVASQREAVAVADSNLNTISNSFKGTINNLYDKYQKLKLSLSENKTKLTSTFDKLNESKKDLADWSGKQLEQLDAMNEDRDLNMMSQNYKHIMWSILAIVIIIGIIKLTKSFGGIQALDTTKSVDIPKIPAAATAPTAAT